MVSLSFLSKLGSLKNILFEVNYYFSYRENIDQFSCNPTLSLVSFISNDILGDSCNPTFQGQSLNYTINHEYNWWREGFIAA